MLLLSDGKILVGGEFTQIAGGARTNLARLHSNGQLDASFQADTDGAVYKLLQQADEKVLVGGSFANLQGVACLRLGRLLTNGLVDSGFDAGTNFGDMMSILTLAVQADEKILAASFDAQPAVASTLRRLHADGQLDGGFINTNLFNDWYVNALLSRTNGDIWVGGGFQRVNGITNSALAILDSLGRFNTNYTGKFQRNSSILSLAETAEGSVLAGGALYFTGAVNTNRLVLGQLSVSGEWNTNFVGDEFGISNHALIRSIVVEPDGKILVGGSFYLVNGYYRRDIARLDAAGHLDKCFDPGIGFGDWGNSPDAGIMTMVRQPDGRILVGGKFEGVDGVQTTNITRLLPQSDCDSPRLQLVRTGPDQFYVAGSTTPGASSYVLQSTTNLLDWEYVQHQPYPYVYAAFEFSAQPARFFRILRVFDSPTPAPRPSAAP